MLHSTKHTMKTLLRNMFWILLAFLGGILVSWVVNGEFRYMLIAYGALFILVSYIRVQFLKDQKARLIYLIMASLVPTFIFIFGMLLFGHGEIPLHSAPIWLMIIPVSNGACYVILKMSESKRKWFSVGYIVLVYLLGMYGFPVWSSYYSTHIWESPYTTLLNTHFSQDVVLEDEHGNIFNMNDLKGKIVVMEFWSTSCGLCFKGFPTLETFYNEMKNDPEIFVVAVNLPLEGEHRDQLQRINGFDQYKFPKLYAQHPEAWKQLGIRAVPLAMVLDKQGKIRHVGGLNVLWHNIFKNTYSLIKKLKEEPYS